MNIEDDHDLLVDLASLCLCDPTNSGDFQSWLLLLENLINARCWQQSGRFKFPVVETEYF